MPYRVVRRDLVPSAGIALVEAVVATGLFALVVVAVLAHLQAARRAQAVGEGLAELQQSTRAAFDRIARDLRLAGLAVDPDGDGDRPDEPIEGAFERALVLRADLDAGTADADEPEEALAAGGPFANVTTGNDEIVAYVLAAPDGSSGDAVVFEADVEGVPRDGAVETVKIPHVTLDQAGPPYTLYRIRVKQDSTATLRSPVAENVASMTFRYFDAAGNGVAPPGGGDDAEARRARASIRRIRIDLVGVSRAADPLWVDETDPHPATRRRRKFRIAGDVAPANLAAALPSPGGA